MLLRDGFGRPIPAGAPPGAFPGSPGMMPPAMAGPGMPAGPTFSPGISPTGSMMRADGYPGQPLPAAALRPGINPTSSAGIGRLAPDRVRTVDTMSPSAGAADASRGFVTGMGAGFMGAGDASRGLGTGMRLGPSGPSSAEMMGARATGVAPAPAAAQSAMPGQQEKKPTFFRGLVKGLGDAAHAVGFGEEFDFVRTKSREAKLGIRSWVAKQMEVALANHDENQINSLLDQALDSTLAGESTPHVVSHAAGKISQKRLQEALQDDKPKSLKAAMLMAQRLNSTHLAEYQQARLRYAELRKFPEGWIQRMEIQRRGGKLVAAEEIQDPNVLQIFQALMDSTMRKVYTRDRMGHAVPDRLVVNSVIKIENGDHWVDYMSQQETVRREIHADSTGYQRLLVLTMTGELEQVSQQLTTVTGTPPLDTLVNEAWLFHGTSNEAARLISHNEFKISRAGSNAGTLYGRGVYLAENCSKSDEYSRGDAQGLRTMLICRTTLGRAFYSDDVNVNPRSCEDICMRGPYHSILGDRLKARGTFREFVVYDEDQVYPNFIVRYRQVMNPAAS